VDAIFGAMLQFDLRNGPARKKFDSLKYTLKKLESLLYELQLAGPFQSTRLDGPDGAGADNEKGEGGAAKDMDDDDA
jgi:hypothetical protein